MSLIRFKWYYLKRLRTIKGIRFKSNFARFKFGGGYDFGRGTDETSSGYG